MTKSVDKIEDVMGSLGLTYYCNIPIIISPKRVLNTVRYWDTVFILLIRCGDVACSIAGQAKAGRNELHNA